ncbi:MAG TPA: hypothetical protein VMV25_07000 [Steroidobacteraceae bacterium]|nr:hypothetical protein [Steroidobacteraceae bacterium]
MPRKQPKTEFVGIRMPPVDVEALRVEAGQCGRTMSELIRRRITAQLVTSRTDQETSANTDRLHAYDAGVPPNPELIAEAVNVIVSIRRTATGRRVEEVAAVRGWTAGGGFHIARLA